jgi:hypothetical protein
MDLGAEKNPDPTVIVVDQLGSGFLTQTQKIREAVNLRIKVRRRDDGVNPGGSDVDGVNYAELADGKPALELDSDGFTVRFVGAADVTYTLEYIDDLARAGNDAEWHAVTGSAVTPTKTALVELTDAAAYGSTAPAKRFYRIKSTIE